MFTSCLTGTPCKTEATGRENYDRYASYACRNRLLPPSGRTIANSAAPFLIAQTADRPQCCVAMARRMPLRIRPVADAPQLEILNRLIDLLFGIHDKRSISDDRLFDRLAGQHEKRCLFVRRDVDVVAFP